MSALTLMEFDRANTTVAAAALEDVGAEMILAGRYDRIVLEIQNNGAAAGDDLADFAILVKPHHSAGWITLISGGSWASLTADYSAFFFVTDPSSLAKGASSYVNVYLGPVYAVKFQAKAAATKTTSVKIYGTVQAQGKR
jgi:hypothetical protein